VVVVERKNDQGQRALFTGAAVLDRRPGVLAQLSVPFDNLQRLVAERWLALLSIVVLITLVAALATVWVSRSIVQPLYQLRESAVKLSQGNLSHRVDYAHRDEIGEVAAAFNEMADEVRSMLEEQRAFASNTSHELRTPLTTIRLRSEALRYDDQLDPATARQYIAEIDDEVIRLGALIEDLTLLSRFDAGRAELGNTQIDVGRLAASLQSHMATQARAKGVTLEFTAPPETVVVSASMNHLNVVLRNVLDNAVKYTQEGGRIAWQLTACGTGAQFHIEDTGQGILPEHLPHLFERFYRADRARSRDVPGTGLGLALVKSILDAYGGSITIHSAGRGRGTQVTIVWPHRISHSSL
jgi:signal transduction histidine kinase